MEGSTHYLRDTENSQRSFTIAPIQATETNGRSVVFTMDAAEAKHIGEGKQENVDKLKKKKNVLLTRLWVSLGVFFVPSSWPLVEKLLL